jgi:hypothetical protein
VTSLFQALQSGSPVQTLDSRGKQLTRWYYIDIAAALADPGDRDEAIVSVPEDRVIREDFGRQVKADYSTRKLECEADMFPLGIVFDRAATTNWLLEYVDGGPEKRQRWMDFDAQVLQHITSYIVPVIRLTKETPKEAVCTVFEKVNTGGVPLDVFELLTATFAGEGWYRRQHGDDFRLNDDWQRIRRELAPHRVLASFQSTDFLQVVSLLATLHRGQGVSCKKKDVLKLTLRDYLDWSPKIVEALLWAARFLAQEHIFRPNDLPYRTQLVPLAAIRVVLGDRADVYSINSRLRRWYWCGVLGELYGGSTETRFARDLEQVVPWVEHGGPEPGTVAEASFHEQRLLTMRTRNSAAYNGVFALLMRAGCADWLYNRRLDLAAFFDLAVDIHHIFPKAWCMAQGIDYGQSESIVNKTALAAATNRRIGGRSPVQYVHTIEGEGVTAAELDRILVGHRIVPEHLRQAEFDRFFTARTEELLGLIGDAMGKAPVRTTQAPDQERPEDFAVDAEEEPAAVA